MTSGAAICRDVRVVVGLRLAVAAQHGQCVACQRLQLVLAGVDEDRGDEVDMRGDEIREPLVVGDAAGEQDRIRLAFEGDGHRPDLFGHVVAHGAQHQHRLQIVVVDPPQDFGDRRRAEVCEQAAAAVDEFLQLFAGVFSRKAKVDQRSRRQRAGALRRKRPCAVEGVGGVDHAPLAVRADGDAASHVRDDQVQLFVFPTRFAGVPACDGLLVEGVEDRFARQLGQSRNACVGNHLVHHDRIGDIGLDTDLGCDLLCDQSAQIRGVLPPGVEQVVVQCVVHLVDPALDGMNQPAAADDGREGADVKSAFAQRFEHEVFPPFELVADRRERGDLGGGVVDRQRKDGLRIFVDGDLRGGRARVNSQNDVAHGRGAYCRFGRGFQCVSGRPGRPVRWSTSWSGASRRAR